MNSLTLKSPAKVNLHLEILGRFPDGYHKLSTLFHRLSLADTLILSKRGDDFSFSSNSNLPKREGNLIFKAYLELKKKFPKLGGVHVRLQKKIPIGAGLGGGSSNAAFFLIGMKKIYNLKISKKEFLAMGRRIGADVPFFMIEASEAWASGVGEKLKPRNKPEKFHFLLITDPKPLATVQVYQTYAGKEGRKKKKGRVDFGINDLQAPAIRLRPSIGDTLRKLEKCGAKKVLMSGSGPTVFAVSPSQGEMKKLQRVLPSGLKKRSVLCHSA